MEQKININSGFFDSINNDRLYGASDMNRPYKRIITEGIFATPQGTPSTDLQVVSAGNYMNVLVKKGEGLLGGKWFENPTDVAITVSGNTAIVPRRDSIIIQVDNRQSGRNVNIVYREGIPSSTPLPPDIGTVTNVIERRVANIYVAPGATHINQDAIVDLRGSSELLWITSLIKQVDTSTLYAQWQAAYENYFNETTEDINEYISATTADLDTYMGTTQELFNTFMESLVSELTVNTNIITYESHYISTADGETVVPINIAAYRKDKDVLMVYVNRLRATPGVDYSIAGDGKSITLTKDIYKNNNVDFLVLQTVVAADVETVLQEVQKISAGLTDVNSKVAGIDTKVTNLTSDSGWINFSLESGATSFDATTTPAIRKYGNQVFIRGAIKGFDTLNVPLCTLPVAHRPVMNHKYPAIAYTAAGAISASCVLEVRTTGSVYLVAKSGTVPATAILSIATNFITG